VGGLSHSRGRAAFTLLELLIVLVVLALVSSLAVPAWFERSEVTLDNACRLLARDLREAQNRAAWRGQPLQVVFDGDGDGYEVLDRDGRPVPAPVGGDDFTRRYSRDAIFRGVAIARLELESGSALEFDAHGFAAQGAEIVVTFQGEARVVRVERGSGQVRIQGMATSFVDLGD